MLLSDLHIGSTVGLWPEGFICSEGYPIGQNKFQEWFVGVLGRHAAMGRGCHR